jgi:hypothetical protein
MEQVNYSTPISNYEEQLEEKGFVVVEFEYNGGY